MSVRTATRGASRRTTRNQTSTPDGSQIPERTICLVADIKRVGNRRKVSSAQVEVDADKEAISVSKTLLDAPQLLAIINLDTTIRRYVNTYCLPSLFRGGVFLLPLVSVEAVDARLQEFQSERAHLVDVFMEDYPSLVRNAQARLRGLFDPRDYPGADLVRHEFGFTWRYVTFSVPSTLAVIDRHLFERERENAAQQWDEAAAAIQSLLRANMLQLVHHMNERLTPDADGKAKFFKNSLVSNLSEFLKNFDARNVTDDNELAAVVARARQLLDGVDPQVLRDSQDIREGVRDGFVQVQRQLNTMIVNRPVRRIVVDRPAVNRVDSAVAGVARPRQQGPELEEIAA